MRSRAAALVAVVIVTAGARIGINLLGDLAERGVEPARVLDQRGQVLRGALGGAVVQVGEGPLELRLPRLGNPAGAEPVEAH